MGEFARVLLLVSVAVLGIETRVLAADGAGVTYPSRPVRYLLPFPPGGPSDIVARLFGQKLGEALGQQVVLDNRGGASGAIASEIAARAAPDGHTLLQCTIGTMAINPALFPKLPYDPLRDFRTVTQLAGTPYMLVVHPAVPAKSVKDLIALAKARPGQLNFGSGGVGTTNHFSGELFRLAAGVNIVHVPYKGTGPAMTDLIGGQVQMMFMNLLPAMPQVRGGKLRGVAVTSAKRSVAAPDIPTVAESGLPGYETTGWHGLVVPAKTPAAIVLRLQSELAKIARVPDVRERLAAEGTETLGNTPDEFAAVLKAEIIKWAGVVKAAGIKAE
ncbi:MAG: tripartite tricarboxylate transporter substrate binding protein [Burkholderiales bacterium]